MALTHVNFHIVTGGPGAGKTAVIDALRARGCGVVDEVGRAIIRSQQAIGGDAVHTGDWRLYAELMLSRSIADYERQANEAGPVFFDRGIAELVGYFRLMGSVAPAHFLRAAEVYRYAPTVFVAPPWREIYRHDGERKQDFDEAVATHDAVTGAYVAAGYQLVDLPRASVEERAAFVLERIGTG